MAKFFPVYSALVVLLAGAIVLFSFSKGYAPTKLSDAELSDVEAQSLFSIERFSGNPTVDYGSYDYWPGSQDVVRLKLGLDLYQGAHFYAFKWGYWNNGSQTGWDQDTTNYFWGTTDRNTPLKWTGVFIDFGFDNFTSNANRHLNYVEVGTMSASGQVAGFINTISQLCVGGTGTNQGVLMRQTAAGDRIVPFNNVPMGFVFATRYRWWTSGGYGTDNLRGIFVKTPAYNSNDSTAFVDP